MKAAAFLRHPAARLVFLALVSGLASAADVEGAEAPAVAPTVAPAASTAAAPVATPAATEAAAADTAAEAVDWHVDPTGRRYRLEHYPKSYPHQELPDGKLRTAWGVVIELEGQDGDSYIYRVYEPLPNSSGPVEVVPPVPPEVKASYELTVPTVDRVALTPFDEGLPREGQWRNGFVVADIDKDGFLDIIHGPARKSGGVPVVFLGDGKGHWRRWQATFPKYPYDYGDVAVGDLDHDGRLDIVLGAHLRGLVALVQKQPGQFELWSKGLPYRTENGGTPGFSSRSVAVLDWNGDRRPDIAALSEGPQLQVDRSSGKMSDDAGLFVWLNQGDGSWKALTLANTKSGLFGDHLEVADIDGDGRPDLLASSNMEGRKDLIYLSGKKLEGRRDSIGPMRHAYARAVTTLADASSRQPDIAASFLSFEIREWKTGVDVFSRGKDKAWKRKLVWVENGNAALWALASGDVDGDGRPDLVGLTGDGRTILLLNDGSGGFAQQPLGEKPVGSCIGSAVQVVDLDGDKRGEIITEWAGEQVGTPGISSSPGCPGEGSLRVWKVAPKGG